MTYRDFRIYLEEQLLIKSKKMCINVYLLWWFINFLKNNFSSGATKSKIMQDQQLVKELHSQSFCSADLADV